MRRVQRYVPEFEKRWNGYACKSGRSWRVDETYLKVRGRRVYLYGRRREGNTVDFRLSPKRDVTVAKAFFRKALRTQRRVPVSSPIYRFLIASIHYSNRFQNAVCTRAMNSKPAARRRPKAM